VVERSGREKSSWIKHFPLNYFTAPFLPAFLAEVHSQVRVVEWLLSYGLIYPSD
jgi:hypothetical protein